MSNNQMDASSTEIGAEHARSHRAAGRVPGARADAAMKALPRSIVPGRESEGTRGPELGSVSDRPSRRRSLSPDDRKLLVGSLGVLLAVFALVASNVAANHSPKPHGLPIVLAVCAVLGAGVALIAYRLRTHAKAATVAG